MREFEPHTLRKNQKIFNMEKGNITLDNSDRLSVKSTDKIKIVRETNIGGYVIPYEIVIDYNKLPKGKEDFYLDLLIKLL